MMRTLRALLVTLTVLTAGCACHQPPKVQPDPPVRVSRCHAIVEGVTCGDAADRYVLLCSCVVET